MGDMCDPAIRIDLTQLRLLINLWGTLELALQFDSTSRRCYPAVIGLGVRRSNGVDIHITG